MTRCFLCNWPLNDEHSFNVNCAAANAENDQLEAEVREAVREAEREPVDDRLLQHGLEVARETLALIRFRRDCREM